MQRPIKQETTQEQKDFINMMEKAITVGMALFNIGEIDGAALLGIVVGNYIGHRDDVLMHNKEFLTLLKAAIEKDGGRNTKSPCLDTFMVNMTLTSDEHKQKHERIRQLLDNEEDVETKMTTQCSGNFTEH